MKVPDICAKLFCYCGCDLTDNHASLLDCFKGDHYVDCSICQDEAILALELKKQGKSLAEIQKAVDNRFLKQYHEVFKEPSEALLKYRKQRLWQPSQPEEPADASSAPNKANTTTKPKQPGCCGNK